MSRKALLLLGCVALAQGYTTFSTTCTTPTTPVNFVSSADSRGTLDILWSCLFTIFACTWTIQHLNVPEQRENRDPGLLGDIKWALKSFWTSTKWMLATAIAPEMLLGKAWGDLMAAKETLGELQEFAENDGVSWTLTHSLFANMGGFVIRWNLGERDLKETYDSGTQTTPGDLEQHQLKSGPHHALSHNNSSNELSLPSDRAIYTNPFHLTARNILELRRKEIIKKLPDFTVEDINDKSKTDTFSRAISTVQITWTAIQIIARAVKRLAISQLEIAVMAFAVCAITIYGFNWKKPKGVKVPYTLLRYGDGIPDNVYEIILKRYEDDSGVLSIIEFLGRGRIYGSPVPNTYLGADGWKDLPGLFLGCTVFGGLHLAAWNFEFPSRPEKIFWCATSLWCTCYMLIWWLVIKILEWQDDHSFIGEDSASDEFTDAGIGIFIMSSTILYLLARLFLLVEIFRTLFFLPPDAFISTWASEIPHIA